MKKLGFTLAEVLITLMILGIIAALTVPSLIQNTQKKEQIVQMKKGLSMINQAITMNYALTQEDLSSSTYATASDVVTMLRGRLSVVQYNDTEANAWLKTQDGLTYYIKADKKGDCGKVNAEIYDYDKTGDDGISTGTCFDIIISTLPDPEKTYADAKTKVARDGQNLPGYYQFYAGADRVVPDSVTQDIMMAKDATKKSS